MKNLSSTPYSLYSQRSISIATYIGGPIAAGILIRRNFINLGKENEGQKSLIIGIIATFLLFIGLYITPEDILDKIPNMAIPLIYTAIVYFVVERSQGQDLKNHQINEGLFYSTWKAAGIGGVYLVVMVAGVFAYSYLEPYEYDYEKYNSYLEEFEANEEIALETFSLLESEPLEDVSAYIFLEGAPAWVRNLYILDEMSLIENLDSDLIKQNYLLEEYCNLRIEQFQLIDKAIIENTDDYDDRMDAILLEIEIVLDKL